MCIRDSHGTAHVLGSVQFSNSLGSGSIVFHFDESESFGSTGLDVYKRQLLHWLFVRIAENGMYITQCVVLADITEVSSQLRKKQLYN